MILKGFLFLKHLKSSIDSQNSGESAGDLKWLTFFASFSNLFRFLLTILPPYVWAHHNLILMIRESTNEKTLFEVSEIQLNYKSKASIRPKISSSRDAENILRQYWNDDLLELQEEFKITLLDCYNKVIGIFTASFGGIAGTVADPKLIFAYALKGAASGIILAHNHPSGSLQAVKLISILPKNCETVASS